MFKNAFAVGFALLLPASAALAQQQTAVKACAGDIKTLCAGVQPGGGRVSACVKQHFTGLSDPCQAELTKAATIGKLCAADIKQNCAGVNPGGGRIEACVKSHLSDLSEPCKDALTQAAADRT
jgi:hypothetical protein